MTFSTRFFPQDLLKQGCFRLPSEKAYFFSDIFWKESFWTHSFFLTNTNFQKNGSKKKSSKKIPWNALLFYTHFFLKFMFLFYKKIVSSKKKLLLKKLQGFFKGFFKKSLKNEIFLNDFLILKDDFFNRGLFLGFFGLLNRKVSSQQGLNWKNFFFFVKRTCLQKKSFWKRI